MNLRVFRVGAKPACDLVGNLVALLDDVRRLGGHQNNTSPTPKQRRPERMQAVPFAIHGCSVRGWPRPVYANWRTIIHAPDTFAGGRKLLGAEKFRYHLVRMKSGPCERGGRSSANVAHLVSHHLDIPVNIILNLFPFIRRRLYLLNALGIPGLNSSGEGLICRRLKSTESRSVFAVIGHTCTG